MVAGRRLLVVCYRLTPLIHEASFVANYAPDTPRMVDVADLVRGLRNLGGNAEPMVYALLPYVVQPPGQVSGGCAGPRHPGHFVGCTSRDSTYNICPANLQSSCQLFNVE